MQSKKKRIVVRHYTLETSAGNDAAEVCAAIHEGNPGFRIYDTLPVSAGEGDGSAFPLLGMIGGPDNRALLTPDRLLFRLSHLFDAPDDCPHPRTALLCRPATSDPQYPALAKTLLPRIKAELADYGVEHVAEADQHTLPATLAGHLDNLEQGHRPDLLLVAVDSLINPAVMNTHVAHHDARTTANPHGRVLSEALCVLWLQAVDPEADPDVGELSLDRLSISNEPDDTWPDRRWHQALANAAAQALGVDTPGDLSNPTPRPAHIMLARAQTMTDEMIWYQTHSSLWPLRLSPRDNLAMRKGEKPAPQPEPLPPQQVMRPAMTLGDTGAATLPVAIILATQWMRNPENLGQPCLLLDHVERQRLAVLIQPGMPAMGDAQREVAHA
ncbi:MAG: hypothetical protein C0462_06370 [Alcanivorax sp.]|nr:hypothetical protein [Alcanivorax sp.]